MAVRIKRVYEDPAGDDGVRVLVDRLWPRGVSKEDAALDRWLKEIAPSDELRREFGHDPGRWEQFAERYFAELEEREEAVEAVEELQDLARRADVTLVYAARDSEHNNAVALKRYLESRTAERD